MKDHYVSFECAKALKRLGFDWEVRGYYTRDDNFQKVWEVTALNHNDTKKFKNILSAPRIDQAAAWMREVKGVHIILLRRNGLYVSYVDMGYGIPVEANTDPADYESSISSFIDKALELLGKEENNGM